MKLSPMIQYKTVFYIVTAFLAVPLSIILIIAIFNPFWFRDSLLRYCERLAGRMAEWRDSLRVVKYLDNKAHLFDILRGSK